VAVLTGRNEDPQAMNSQPPAPTTVSLADEEAVKRIAVIREYHARWQAAQGKPT
jgi:hypothetical protein